MCTWLTELAPLTVGPVHCGLYAPSSASLELSPSPFPRFFLLLDEAYGAINAD
jgi:hypothetical protein